MKKRVLIVWGLALSSSSVSCFEAEDSAGADYGYMDDDIPSGERCATGTSGGEGSTQPCETSSTGDPDPGAAGSPCDGSLDCNDDLVCAAFFDRGERGVYACVEACIGVMDEARWCADASACCDPDAVCTARGYCISPDNGDTGDTDETGDTGDTTGAL
jgi:hypothetical protein